MLCGCVLDERFQLEARRVGSREVHDMSIWRCPKIQGKTVTVERKHRNKGLTPAVDAAAGHAGLFKQVLLRCKRIHNIKANWVQIYRQYTSLK